MQIKFLSDNEIHKAIQSIERRENTLRQDMHRVAMSIAKVWHDCEKGKELEAAALAAERFSSLLKVSGYHANAFGKWVSQMFSNLKYDTTKKAFHVAAKGEPKLMGKAFIAARDLPFWELTPPQEYKPVDLDKEVYALLSKVDKRIEKGLNPDQGDKVDMGRLRALKAVMSMDSTDAVSKLYAA